MKIKNYLTSPFFVVFLILIVTRILKVVFAASLEVDEGGELLVARHIVKFGEYPLIGHHCSGTNLFYSFNYFYFLALLTAIFDNPYFIFLCMAIFNICAGFFLYKTVQLLINKKVGLLVLLFYTFSPQFIISANVWPAYIGTMFCLISFYFLVAFNKFKKKLYFLIHLGLFSFACTVQVTQLVWIPFAAIYITLSLGNYKVREGFSFFIEVFKYLSIYIISFFILNLNQFLYYKFSLVQIFGLNNINSPQISFFSALQALIYRFIRDALGIEYSFIPLLLYLLLLCVFFYRKRARKTEVVILSGLILSIMFFFNTISRGKIFSHHLLILHIPFFVQIAIMIDSISNIYKINWKWNYTLFWVVISLIAVSGRLLLQKDKMAFPYNSLREIEQASISINGILSNTAEYGFIQNSPMINESFFPSPEFIYFIERINGKKMVSIKSGVQFYTTIKNKPFQYLICRKYWEHPYKHNVDICLKAFTSQYINYTFMKQVFRSSNIEIFLFKNRVNINI